MMLIGLLRLRALREINFFQLVGDFLEKILYVRRKVY